ncbi:unnamed protein product [Leptosia nina]|uniref:Uncharacterized protein n=1 Tax=Leptosia nina TaxID=320188 RepID=A0AAV1J3N7_9NEOP
MKYTIAFITIVSISATWAIKAKVEDPKDKREAAVGYASPGHSSQAYSFQAPAQGHEDASSISIGAGYSVGGGKPTYSFANQISGAPYQIPSEGLPASGHAALQLAPITLQPSHGLVSNDLSQLMSQLSQGINSGAISLPSGGQGAVYQFGGQSAHGGQEFAFPQFAYSSPNMQQYTLGEQAQPAVPSYASGTKGLGSYSSTGPVLFSPESHSNQGSQNYAVPSGGHSVSEGALSYADAGQSVPSYSLGSSGHSYGGSLKAYAGGHGVPVKTSFKPSAFLGSVQSEGHGLSGSYAAPSFGNYQSGGLSLGAHGHGASFGSLGGLSGASPKYVSQSYLPAKSEGLGSLESIASAFSTSGQLGHSSHGPSHGFPSSAYSSSNVHSASAHTPQYYVSSSKHAPGGSFGSGSVSYKGPISGHSSLNSFSSGPKYSFGGQSSRYLPAKDSHGAYSETSYNTIKYSEELKPRIH